MPVRLDGEDLIVLDMLGISLSSAIAPASVPCVGFVWPTPVDIIASKSSSRASLLGAMFFVVEGSMPYTKMSSLCIHAERAPPFLMLTSISRFTFSGG